MKKKVTALALALVMVLGLAAVAAGGDKNIAVTPMNMTINGQAVTPLKSDGTPAEVFAYDGATYVPLRYLSETLGIQVEWDPTAPNTAKLVNVPAAELKFTAGTYTGKAMGYNAPVSLNVTFSDSAVTKVEIAEEKETAHVGTSAYDIMFADIVAANGTGIDGISGATFTGFAIKNAVNDAATQAGCSNMDAFKKNTVKHEPKAPIEGEWDVVIVGAGGAGMAAAAQAAQNGSTVLVLEKAAEMGGNTLVAGGAFQISRDYLVWDAKHPNATTGKSPLDGKTYDKVKSDAGRIETLRVIADWSEKEFDGTLDDAHPFVAGDIKLNAVRGVHKEYLPTLKTLKKQINEYLKWADAKMKAGAKETDLVVFSTEELHIFQTYYGGLRPNAAGTEWIYGDFDLVSQFIHEGQDMSEWLMDQGALVGLDKQNTLIGCLWQRTNAPLGGVVDGVTYETKWGTYFKVPENTMRKANAKNDILYRTTAEELIVENGKVTGVKATQYDGTPVTVKAKQGVIIATGGYAANIKMVQETNEYWDPAFIANNIGTTNRSGMTGDGIIMGQKVGAAVTGMGWTQMMPLGWVDNGNLSRGAGENVIFISPNTGKRYVDESAERDVLSKGGFENGMSKELAQELGLKYVPGIYVELSNPTTNASFATSNIENRCFVLTVAEVAQKLHLDEAVLRKTITDYDNYVMGLTDKLEVEKLSLRNTIGDVEKDDKGNYKPETYKLDKVILRFQAPSTHHTMGGLVVDTERKVLDESGKAIPGLWAAGEVTGGFMAGNRLGGNATTEIIVSGRVAANSVTGKK